MISTGAFFVIWNVGQGQFQTLSHPESCYHLDMGGEFIDWSQLKKLCSYKNNFVLFSHWDWDHINFAKKALSHLPNLCLLRPPLGPAASNKISFLKSIPKCQSYDLPKALREIVTTKYLDRIPNLIPNDHSRIFTVENKILIPGDSTSRVERRWAADLHSRYLISTLILGHHGSQTSTSEYLLNRVPRLKMAISSARQSRYGHPHPKVLKRLRDHKVAILKTEIWNHIYISLDQ